MSFDANLRVGAGSGQPFFDQMRQEARLEAAPYERALCSRLSPRGKDRPQSRCAPSPSAGEDPIDLIDVKQAQDRCLLYQAAELLPA